MTKEKQQWGSRIGLILAMAGNAVGLGNFLRFPAQAVQNGGGAFIIPYLVCFVLMGIPLLWIEWSMGRYGGRYGNHSTPFILNEMGKKALWKYIGVFGIFTNVAVAAYYCYIESWTMSYVMHSIMGTFNGMDRNAVASFFDSYVDIGTSTTGIPYEAVIFYVFCLLLNTYILSKGLDGVEKVAKVGMPLLILFGIFLAVRAITLQAGDSGAVYDGTLGLNYLWTPDFNSLYNPNVWLAAAGQIFFTLSVGMGTVHCYASYLNSRDDVALNAMSAGWMNEFVEVVVGASIVIPITVGYFGVEGMLEIAKQGSFALGFKTMPYLFYQWGSVLAPVAGVMFFGLLFFAGITSSLAMGTPWMGFMHDEYGWGRKLGAWSFGLFVLVLGLPTVFFYQYGVFDEYDDWAGTNSLFVFALAETVLFAWIFGIKKGWQEITLGADFKVPGFFRYVIGYVTPVLLLLVFLANIIKPVDNDWGMAFSGLFSGDGWPLDNGSLIKKITMNGLRGEIAAETDNVKRAFLEKKLTFTIIARLILVAAFLFISFLVYRASKLRTKKF
ncbi:MAG: sodium-dependent transporter [Flavobacteriales bacterium]